MKAKDSDLGKKFCEDYVLGEYIDDGGNGQVHEIKRRCDNQILALKYLKKISNKSKYRKRMKRFVDEINTLQELKKLNTPYVMPLLDYNTSNDGLYWYVMPLGKSVPSYFIDEKISVLKKLEFLMNIARGIKTIHELEYYHRDIKPTNLLIVNDEIMLADFGLVWHPSFDERTEKGEKVGPNETIAPEMREDNIEPKHSGKADIYSFVKTIWMLLLNRSRAFVDHYSYETIGYLETSMEEFRNSDMRTFKRLNELIMRGTEYTPIKRPDIDFVISELEQCMEDNKLSENQISEMNISESVSKKLYEIKSDVEIYVKVAKMIFFLSEILSKAKFNAVTVNGSSKYEIIFSTDMVRPSEVNGCILFVDNTIGNRYLVRAKRLELNKLNGQIKIITEPINISDIPDSQSYEYHDYNSDNSIDKLFAGFQEINTKTRIDVLTKSEEFTLELLNL